MKQEICVLAVYVHSIEEAKKYYCDVLGFEIAQEYDECIIRLKNEGVTLLLELIGGGYPPHPCVVPALETDNIVSEIQLLKSKGVEFIFDEPQEFPAGIYTAFKDSSGNIIELLEFRK
ncbi:MAG: VOC family protein [Calditrichaeota bacterium]|nr:VOC family protein [Calditrichota bacterium]